MTAPTPREEFFLRMYEQMWGNINRHIWLVWQPVTVLVATGALYKVALDGPLPVGLASSVVFILLGWFVAHLLDANGWYFRNHLIVANIEQFFGEDGDQELINPFLGEPLPPRKMRKMLTSLQINMFLAIALFVLTLILTLIAETVPVFSGAMTVEFMGQASGILPWLPYFALVASVLYVAYIYRNRLNQYQGAYAKAMEGRKG